jgi:hypothetical protein
MRGQASTYTRQREAARLQAAYAAPRTGVASCGLPFIVTAELRSEALNRLVNEFTANCSLLYTTFQRDMHKYVQSTTNITTHQAATTMRFGSLQTFRSILMPQISGSISKSEKQSSR